MVRVRNNTVKQRFEIYDDDELAGFAEYRQDGDLRTFVHTEILDEFEGQGIASRLASAALDSTRTSGHRIAAECPFIRGYMARHPDQGSTDASG